MKAGNNMSSITKPDGQTTLQAERVKPVSPAGPTANFLYIFSLQNTCGFSIFLCGLLYKKKKKMKRPRNTELDIN